MSNSEHKDNTAGGKQDIKGTITADMYSNTLTFQ